MVLLRFQRDYYFKALLITPHTKDIKRLQNKKIGVYEDPATADAPETINRNERNIP